MGRIGEAFERTKREGRAALVVYLCAGDPHPDESSGLLLAAAEGGADILEIGVPFSDPTADGVAIQRASHRALEAGTTVAGVLAIVREVRQKSDIPIVLFGYYNPLLSFGENRIARAAKDAGADGFLVVDLPPEDSGSFRAALREVDLDFVPLLAPTSGLAREAQVQSVADSFVYYVSLTGVTGATGKDLEGAAERARTLATRLGRPVAVGFGIKTAEDAAAVGRMADGVVVGTALVEAVALAPSPAARKEVAGSVVRELRDALRAARTD